MVKKALKIMVVGLSFAGALSAHAETTFTCSNLVMANGKAHPDLDKPQVRMDEKSATIRITTAADSPQKFDQEYQIFPIGRNPAGVVYADKEHRVTLTPDTPKSSTLIVKGLVARCEY